MAKKKQHHETEKDAQQEAATETTEGGRGFHGAAAEADESDVKRPTLQGRPKEVKPKFEQPGTNNISSVDIGQQEAEAKAAVKQND